LWQTLVRVCYWLWLFAGTFLLSAAWTKPKWAQLELLDVLLPIATIVLCRYWARGSCFPEQPAWHACQIEAPVLDEAQFQSALPTFSAIFREHERQREATEKKTSKVAERIQQLAERTRICTRQEWEEEHLPQLDNIGSHLRSVEQCCLCMSDVAMDDQVRGLACGHAFHLSCVAEWFMRDSTFELSCPLCRVPLHEQQSFKRLDANTFTEEVQERSFIDGAEVQKPAPEAEASQM